MHQMDALGRGAETEGRLEEKVTGKRGAEAEAEGRAESEGKKVVSDHL